jgi:hypothetical protein
MNRCACLLPLVCAFTLASCVMPNPVSVPVPAAASALAPARDPDEPEPVVLPDTESHLLTAKNTGRRYPIWVALPGSYAEDTKRRYPVVFVTDGLYSFPLVRSIRNLLGQKGRNIEDFILVGLPPEQDLSSLESRSRDYTPSNPKLRPGSGPNEYSGKTYGEAAAYRDFLDRQVFPLIAERYRADMQRKVFAGHSLGGLFGSFILLTRPTMFQKYILSSPSLWFDRHSILEQEQAWASVNRDLPAQVMVYNASFETVKPAPRYFRTQDMIGQSRDFVRKLSARGYPSLQIDSQVVPDEDHLTVYPNTINRGLLWALPGRGPYTSG